MSQFLSLPETSPDAPHRSGGPGRRVIVADDSATALRLVRAYLERAGWVVQGVTNGLDALRAAKAQPPAAIVTDGLMPGMDGFLLCRAVRADPDLAMTPVVIYSGVYNTDDDVQLARTAGATLLLTKSDDLSALPALLDDALTGTIEQAPLPRMDDLRFARAHLDRLVAVLLDQQMVLDRALEAERAHVRALAGLDQLRQRLITAVSHELRTPLTVVHGHASLLQRIEGPLDPEQGRRHGRAILGACNRLTTLLDDIMLVGQLQEDQSPFYTMPVALDTAVAAAVATVQERYAPSPCPIEVACPPDLWVQANMRYLGRALTHLLDNAVKHSPQGVAVCVAAAAGDGPDTVVVRVRDRGPGLPQGDVDQLFEPFSKGADEVMRAARVGVGIGLYLVRTLAERMGGTVGARTMPDGGAEFSIRFQASPRPQQSCLDARGE